MTRSCVSCANAITHPGPPGDTRCDPSCLILCEADRSLPLAGGHRNTRTQFFLGKRVGGRHGRQRLCGVGDVNVDLASTTERYDKTMLVSEEPCQPQV